jgi:conjugative transfer region lipoprotein (TIGR03751 family)
MKPIAMLACCVSISALVGGCASTKDAILPQDGPTMMEIYEQHQLGVGAGHRGDQAREALQRPRPVQPGEADLAGYTRKAADEIDARFARLPNPTLVMFIFPHLAGNDAVPVPGFATTFPMYERTHYALPGEVVR